MLCLCTADRFVGVSRVLVCNARTGRPTNELDQIPRSVRTAHSLRDGDQAYRNQQPSDALGHWQMVLSNGVLLRSPVPVLEVSQTQGELRVDQTQGGWIGRVHVHGFDEYGFTLQ